MLWTHGALVGQHVYTFFARYGYVLVLRLEQHGYLGAPTQTQRLANGVQVQYKVPDTKTKLLRHWVFRCNYDE